jgi:hypothetical protein
VTVDAKGRATAGTTLSAADIPTLTTSKLSDANTLEKTANKNAANGYAGLDANVKIPLSLLPEAIMSGQNSFLGNFNASTAVATLTANGKTLLGTTSATITLTNNTAAITGYAANEVGYYRITAAGTFAGLALSVGDLLVADDSGWVKQDNTDAVTSVFGLTGAVTKAGAGLDNVDNTADANKAVLSATKLAAGRNIQTNLGSTAAASFDGSAAITPGVTGTLGIGNGGTSATTAVGAALALGQGYGSDATASATAAKAVTLVGYARFAGSVIAVKHTYTNTAASPTLNVNGTGAAAIYDYRTMAAPAAGLIGNGVHFYNFNGSQWILMNPVCLDANSVIDGGTF